jgi:hypothetical protein
MDIIDTITTTYRDLARSRESYHIYLNPNNINCRLNTMYTCKHCMKSSFKYENFVHHCHFCDPQSHKDPNFKDGDLYFNNFNLASHLAFGASL